VRIVSNAVSEEDRPAGTTWVFSDGSQVMASSCKLDESLNEEEDKEAFFADFERQTQGENFSSQPTSTKDDCNDEQFHQKTDNEDKEATKDDMDDFFDEFEKTTGGENFRTRDDDGM